MLRPVREIEISVPVINTGAMANPSVGDGKLIPVLVIDTTAAPQVAELLRIHQESPPGDVITQWGRAKGQTHIFSLMVTFKRPVEMEFSIDIDSNQHALAIDRIMRISAVFVQDAGPTVYPNIYADAHRIIMEVTAEFGEAKWNKIFQKTISKKFRREGMTKKQANVAAQKYISEWRAFSEGRVGKSPESESSQNLSPQGE